MKNFQLIDHIQTAIAVIDKNMTVVEANHAYSQRTQRLSSEITGKKCFNSAYQFNVPCNHKTSKTCPVEETFKTGKASSQIHHFWISDHAVVEEITTTPVIEENGEINYVIEEFRDVTKLLGLKNGIMSICAYCRKIRNGDDQWITLEKYLEKHTGANFSHGICEECNASLISEVSKKNSSSL